MEEDYEVVSALLGSLLAYGLFSVLKESKNDEVINYKVSLRNKISKGIQACLGRVA